MFNRIGSDEDGCPGEDEDLDGGLDTDGHQAQDQRERRTLQDLELLCLPFE